jgi:hypothetical protein
VETLYLILIGVGTAAASAGLAAGRNAQRLPILSLLMDEAAGPARPPAMKTLTMAATKAYAFRIPTTSYE